MSQPAPGAMTQPAASAGLAGVSARAWATVLLLWPVAMLNYLDRQMVASMRVSIRADIPSIANDADFGLLMSMFLWVYAFLSPVGGFVADRFNRRWTVILSLVIWSTVTWLTGRATTFGEMAWARALMGVSEACYIPAALALIADFHPGPTRSRAIGIHISGIYGGLTLGGVGGYIADTSSWRNAFYWFGAAGVLYGIVLLLFLQDAPRNTAPGGAAVRRLSLSQTIRQLLPVGSFLILVFYFTLLGIAGWAIKSWLPSHLFTAFGLKQGPAGLTATGYVSVASFFGTLIGGVLADRWMRRTERGRIYLSACGTALCLPALLGLGFAPTLSMAILFMMLFGLGFGMFDTNNMPILCQVIPRPYRATGYGIMNMVSFTAGAGVTWLLGRMRDQGISLSVAFLLCAGIVAAAAVLVLFVRPRDARVLENAS
jgi:MFS transporter, Spinster family, sphingosine-1-phosphate transporter